MAPVASTRMPSVFVPPPSMPILKGGDIEDVEIRKAGSEGQAKACRNTEPKGSRRESRQKSFLYRKRLGTFAAWK
jgi:hypothetical protein